MLSQPTNGFYSQAKALLNSFGKITGSEFLQKRNLLFIEIFKNRKQTSDHDSLWQSIFYAYKLNCLTEKVFNEIIATNLTCPIGETLKAIKNANLEFSQKDVLKLIQLIKKDSKNAAQLAEQINLTFCAFAEAKILTGENFWKIFNKICIAFQNFPQLNIENILPALNLANALTEEHFNSLIKPFLEKNTSRIKNSNALGYVIRGLKLVDISDDEIKKAMPKIIAHTLLIKYTIDDIDEYFDAFLDNYNDNYTTEAEYFQASLESYKTMKDLKGPKKELYEFALIDPVQAQKRASSALLSALELDKSETISTKRPVTPLSQKNLFAALPPKSSSSEFELIIDNKTMLSAKL